MVPPIEYVLGYRFRKKLQHSVIYITHFPRESGGCYKRPITAKRGPLTM